MSSDSTDADSVLNLNLHPSLEAVVREANLEGMAFDVRPRRVDQKNPQDREQIHLWNQDKATVIWTVPSIRALFRGDRRPPSLEPQPPADYALLLYWIEESIVAYCDQFGDPTDGEFRDVFSNLRRRPDGQPTTQLHIFLWQVAASLAGQRVISAAEHEAIFTRLTRSATTFRMGLVSRNYITVVRDVIRRTT